MIRVSIVEDDAEYRQMLQQHLNRSEDIRCVSDYGDPREALDKLPHEQVEVVLMDLQLPGMTGVDCISTLRTTAPKLQAIMLTVFEQDEQVFHALAAGACGYLVKRSTPARILDAIREVHQGGSPMSANIARMVVASFHRGAASQPLSPQETQVLAGLARGDTYAAIADDMHITVHTVRNYIRRIYSKLQVHSRTEAVAKFLGKKK